MSTRLKRNAGVALAAIALLVLELQLRAHAGETPNIIHADFGVSAGVVAIVSILSSLFSRFGGKSTDLATKQAIEGMRSDVSSMGKTLTGLFVALAGQLASTVGVVKRFLARVFKPLYDMLKALVERIVRILDKIFGPIIDFLVKVKDHLRDFYNKVIRPIIDTIELVRSVLRLFSLFNVEWAKKLDQKLLELEQYVLAPWEWVWTELNKIISAIDRIVTFDGYLQRALLLQSMLRDAAGVANMTLNTAMKDRGTGLVPRKPGDVDDVEPGFMIKDLEEHFATGNGKYSGAIRESAANVRINLRKAA